MKSERSGISKQLAEMRALADGCTRATVRQRRARLKKLLSLVVEHRQAAIAALRDDLGKSAFESCATEILPLTDILRYLIRKLPKLARSRRAEVSWMNFPASGKVVPEPYGLVLVVATWNYPLLLALEPLAGAYAAGNRVVLKLHDRAPHVNVFLRWIIEEAFGDEVLAIDSELGFTEILREKFDYVFYTGNGQGGREVLRAAAGNLTPATLELGGKSPCIVAPGANLKIAARRIVWGKFTNCGQTCVAPDYLIVHSSLRDALAEQLKRAVRKFYGTSPLDSPDYGHMIDVRAYERVSKLVGNGRLICGGDKQPERLAIEPTVVDRLEADDPLLSEEIFGPVLPVVTYDKDEALFAELRRCGKPLALYCFGGDRKLRARLVSGSSSGALVFNDVVTHFINPGMPFGGVGSSGMGAYHGRRTFETFVHFKPVMEQSRWFDLPFRYPPFSKLRTAFLEFLIRH
jgi:aldehyde dehydrogenase (NAD+)